MKISQVARSVPFDNSTNGFISTEVQSAIEEIQNRTNNKIIGWKDDFLNYLPNQTDTGELQWNAATNGGNGFVTANVLSGTNNSGHPGQLLLGTGTTATGYGFLNLTTSGIVLGGGSITQEWSVFVTTLGVTAQQYTFRFGLGDTTGLEPTNGVYFSYANGITGDFWAIKTSTSSTRTSTTTSSAIVANTWYRLKIVININASSVEYFINDISVGTITTNIPTLPVGPFIGIIKTNGTTARNIYIDYFLMNIILTNIR